MRTVTRLGWLAATLGCLIGAAAWLAWPAVRRDAVDSTAAVSSKQLVAVTAEPTAPPASSTLEAAVPVSEERIVPAFTTLTAGLPAQVAVVLSAEQRVRVIAPAPLQPLVLVTVQDGELRLAGPDVPQQTVLRIEIGVPAVEAVHQGGPGELVIDGLDQRAVRLRVIGNGRIVARGVVHTATCSVVGGGSIDTLGLDATTAIATLAGTGRIALRAGMRLDAAVTGAGVVTYAGDPQVQQIISGGGRVERQP